MCIDELPAEASAKFVDERGIENVGVAQGDDLIVIVEIIGPSKPDVVLRERGTRPRYPEVGVLCRTEQPLSEKMTLLARLVVDLEGKIRIVLTACHRAEKVVANAEYATRRQRATELTRHDVFVVGQGERVNEEHRRGVKTVGWYRCPRKFVA